MDDLVIKARLLNGVSKPADEAKKSVEQLAKAGARAGSGFSPLDRANASIGRMQKLSGGATGGLANELFHTNKFTKMAIKLKTIFGWLGKHKSVFTSLAIAIGLVTAGYILLSLAAYLPIVAVIAVATWLSVCIGTRKSFVTSLTRSVGSGRRHSE